MEHWIKLTLVGLIVFSFPFMIRAQNVAMDSVAHERVLIGPVTRSSFADSTWYNQNYALYRPLPTLIHRIDSLNHGDSVTVVFGSWCSDSHMWVPMFLSITDSTTLAHSIGFIAVPESAGWRQQLTPALDIEKVPTFIFYHDGKEIGRIVEEPRGDLGDDIVEILSGKYGAMK